MKAMKFLSWMVLGGLALAASDGNARTAGNNVEQVKSVAESQIKSIVEPLLEKYCREECRLMSVDVSVDLATPDDVMPGFDDVDSKAQEKIEASSANVRILIDEKVGPNSRNHLTELIRQFLNGVKYPVRLETQTTRFPQPIGSAGKAAELRERVTKQFKTVVDDLFRQFCPEHCMLADYNLQTELVNSEEAQYGAAGEFVEESGVALRIKSISGTILVDESLSKEEQNNVLEMSKLRTNFFKNVDLGMKSMKFPRPIANKKGSKGGAGGYGDSTSEERSLASTESKTATTENQHSVQTTNQNTNNENNQKQERFERFEKIERVENGDAVQLELQKFKQYALIFGCVVLSLLVFLTMAVQRPRGGSGGGGIQRVFQTLTSDPVSTSAPSTFKGGGESSLSNDDKAQMLGKSYEIVRLTDEMMTIFAQQPKVAKHVFGKIITEEGIESAAQYISIFGESVLIELLRDPSLQADLNELMDFYSRNPIELSDDEKLDLLKRLHSKTVAGKLTVMGSRSSGMFDYLGDMDGMQILELIRNESLTVKSIVLTQCDNQKRASIYSQLEDDTRMKLLSELSRIDYLPRDYIFNVANALKRKRRDNPRLNTEALPGSDVLLTLLERSDSGMQRTVVKNLETTNPESARLIKSKLVSLDTLKYLRDGQLLEVVLSLRHDELLQFLKAADASLRAAIMAKSPKELVTELEEELEQLGSVNNEAFQAVSRKLVNRMKVMANDGVINLIETNERMIAEADVGGSGFVEAGPVSDANAPDTQNNNTMKKVSGW